MMSQTETDVSFIKFAGGIQEGLFIFSPQRSFLLLLSTRPLSSQLLSQM